MLYEITDGSPKRVELLQETRNEPTRYAEPLELFRQRFPTERHQHVRLPARPAPDLAHLMSAPATPSARTSRRANSLKIEPTVDYRWQPWNRGRCVSPPEQIRISKRQNESDSPANPPGPYPGRYRDSDQDQNRAHHRYDDSPGKIEFPIIGCWSEASTESAPDKPSRNPERESDQQRERHGPNQV